MRGSEEAAEAGIEEGRELQLDDCAYELRQMADTWRGQAKAQRRAAHMYANTEAAKSWMRSIIATVLEQCADSAEKMAERWSPVEEEE